MLVKDVMTKKPITIEPKATILEATDLMKKNNIKKLPVLDKSGALVGIITENDLQKAAIKYVSAVAQAGFLTKMIDEEFLSEEEINVVKRARNYKTTSHPKNCDIVTYKYATGLEALIGYLDLENKNMRIDEIMKYILGD